MISIISQAISSVFDYNRKNFFNDREQRQKFEYEMLDVRIAQATMWREDIRNYMELTLNKLEAYLLVAALELGFCVVAFCKGRVPPGCPPWLAACHTLSLTGAFMYLFMSVWLGMHGYVAAQAYKVRVLTHFVRLPVPEWKELEAARTYGSQFEKLQGSQILRVPFAMGRQEDRVSEPEAVAGEKPALSRSANGRSSVSNGSTLATPLPGATEQKAAMDPWGLERRANLPEISHDVNEQTAYQKHIWLAREAAKYYETYDAFCRVALSAGTLTLALFFCYYCLSYVLTENASPIAAAAGVCSFVGVAMVLLRLDMKLSGSLYIIASTLVVLPPVVGYWTAFLNSKFKGHGYRSESMMPLVFFVHALWQWFYIYIFRVREMESGAHLPAAFAPVLFLDAFGWARHRASHDVKRQRQAQPTAAHGGGTSGTRAPVSPRPQGALARQGTSVPGNLRRASTYARPTTDDSAVAAASSQRDDLELESQLPALSMTSEAPKRPEDLAPMGSHHSSRARPDQAAVSFRPSTFAMSLVERDEEVANEQDVITGGDALGERPGLLPWRVFLLSTVFYGSLYFLSGIIAIVCQIEGSNFYLSRTPGTYGIADGLVAPLPLMAGERISVTWPDKLVTPQGLATDPHGETFAATGMDSQGRKSVFHSQLQLGDKRHSRQHKMSFKVLESCQDDLEDVEHLQDIVLHGCTEEGGCAALVLPRRGSRLVSCEGVSATKKTRYTTKHQRHNRSLPIHKAWLDDRGAAPIEDPSKTSEDYPEELSSIVLVPCNAHGGSESRGPNREDCLVVGTTARRVVQMGVYNIHSRDTWIPRRVMCEDHMEVPDAGTFALLGGRYLGVLHRKTNSLRVIDLWRAGAHAGTWRLPQGKYFNAITSSDNAFFAMEEGEEPSIWRLSLPAALTVGNTPATGIHGADEAEY